MFSRSMFPLHNRRSCVHTVHQQMCGFHETLVRSRCDMLHVKLLPGQHNLFTVVVVVKRKLVAISRLLLYLSVVVVHVFDLLWNTCNGCVDVEQMSRHVSLITRNRFVDPNKSELTADLSSAFRPGCSCYTCMNGLLAVNCIIAQEYSISHFPWLLFCSATSKILSLGEELYNRILTVRELLLGGCRTFGQTNRVWQETFTVKLLKIQ